jgi:hypothetical protein
LGAGLSAAALANIKEYKNILGYITYGIYVRRPERGGVGECKKNIKKF